MTEPVLKEFYWNNRDGSLGFKTYIGLDFDRPIPMYRSVATKHVFFFQVSEKELWPHGLGLVFYCDLFESDHVQPVEFSEKQNFSYQKLFGRHLTKCSRCLVMFSPPCFRNRFILVLRLSVLTIWVAVATCGKCLVSVQLLQPGHTFFQTEGGLWGRKVRCNLTHEKLILLQTAAYSTPCFKARVSLASKFMLYMY